MEIIEEACSQEGLLMLLHAGAVSKNGRALCLAGKCGSGKSTLIAGLMKQGFHYLGDDLLPLYPDGTVFPVPVSICLKEEGWKAAEAIWPELSAFAPFYRFGKWVKFLPPVKKDHHIWRQRQPLTPLIFIEYAPKAPFLLQKLDPVESLSCLGSTGSLRGHDLGALIKWIERVPAYFLRFSDEASAFRAIEAVSN